MRAVQTTTVAMAFFNITYVNISDLTDEEERGINGVDADGNFHKFKDRYCYVVPKTPEAPPENIIQCRACQNQFSARTFFNHVCTTTQRQQRTKPNNTRGIITKGIVLHKNNFASLPTVGQPLYMNDDSKLELVGAVDTCVGIYVGEGPMVNNTAGGRDRSLLVLLQQ